MQTEPDAELLLQKLKQLPGHFREDDSDEDSESDAEGDDLDSEGEEGDEEETKAEEGSGSEIDILETGETSGNRKRKRVTRLAGGKKKKKAKT